MSPPAPPPPPRRPTRFRATVHGTVFGTRTALLERITAGDPLLLLAGPPLDDVPGVWVHLPGGELLGHLPPEIEAWLSPWMLQGGRATARVIRISGAQDPSWRRVLIEVSMGGEKGAAEN